MRPFMFRSVHESSKNILSNEHCILNCLSCKKRHITLFVVLLKRSGNGTKSPDPLSATFFPRPFLVRVFCPYWMELAGLHWSLNTWDPCWGQSVR
jgi:hypothetical protein